jgi:hypothetical protein
MNKQLTKKTIGIAASAALIASVAFSGSALAAPGNGNGPNKQGPQASLDVMTVCNIDADAGDLIVDITITDPNEGTDKAQAVLESVKVQGLQKAGGKGKGSNEWTYSADSWDGETDLCIDDPYGSPIEIGTTCQIRLDICTGLGDSKAVNAQTTVEISGLTDSGAVGSSKETYMSLCKDDPATEYVDEAILKVTEDLCN